MRLVLLGVRGSTPAPGAEFTAFGGHTSCVAVIGAGRRVPTLVLDAGTGIRALPTLLDGQAFSGAVVLTHLHWDHVQGVPFCPALDHPDAEVTLFVPGVPADSDSADSAARRLFAAGMAPPHFPIGPEGLRGRWSFRAAAPGRLPLEGAVVTVAPIPHKGGATLGVRVDLDGASVAYLPDHALLDDESPTGSAQRLAQGVGLLLHGGPFTAAEATVARAYGHATVEAAAAFADRCEVGELVVTHHAPGRTDAALHDLAATLTHTPGGRPLTFARQGAVLAVPGQPSRRARSLR